MTGTFPPTPPPELVQQWRAVASNVPATLSTETEPRRDYIDFIAAQAAQWGADQELEACCAYMQHEDFHGFATELRVARRPKPPSLKEQAMRVLVENGANLDGRMELDSTDIETIRRALEALDD